VVFVVRFLGVFVFFVVWMFVVEYVRVGRGFISLLGLRLSICVAVLCGLCGFCVACLVVFGF